MLVIKIATLNINGITAPTRVGMLSDFITRREIDILLVQEVTNPDT
jgi:exonuclease III